MPHTGPKPLLPYSTKTQGRRQISISRPVSSRQEVMQTGQTPRPLPKQPDIQTETTEGKPSEPLISTTKRQGWGGQRGGQPQESTKKNPGQTTGPDTEANQPTKGGKGKPARPRGDQTHKRHNKDKTKNHRNQPQKQQGKEDATRSDQGSVTKGNRTKVQ